MEILKERMIYHKDKFISPILYDELNGLEVKRNGKIEHSNNTHDDQVFSYLIALYVWYEGKNLMELYGIDKTSIKNRPRYRRRYDESGRAIFKYYTRLRVDR